MQKSLAGIVLITEIFSPSHRLTPDGERKLREKVCCYINVQTLIIISYLKHNHNYVKILMNI
jgi:hypothetical protein